MKCSHHHLPWNICSAGILISFLLSGCLGEVGYGDHGLRTASGDDEEEIIVGFKSYPKTTDAKKFYTTCNEGNNIFSLGEIELTIIVNLKNENGITDADTEMHVCLNSADDYTATRVFAWSSPTEHQQKTLSLAEDQTYTLALAPDVECHAPFGLYNIKVIQELPENDRSLVFHIDRKMNSMTIDEEAAISSDAFSIEQALTVKFQGKLTYKNVEDVRMFFFANAKNKDEFAERIGTLSEEDIKTLTTGEGKIDEGNNYSFMLPLQASSYWCFIVGKSSLTSQSVLLAEEIVLDSSIENFNSIDKIEANITIEPTQLTFTTHDLYTI